MKILFIGTVEFSYQALRTVLQSGASVVGCITQPDCGINADFVDLSPLCNENHIPLLKTKNINDADTLSWVREKQPDIVFCFGWSRLLKAEFLSLPPMGVIGYHPAALPQNRGRHPIIWALALGLTETASTFFFMDEGADSGDILSQVKLPIGPHDVAADLYSSLLEVSRQQISTFIPQLTNGNYTAVPQDGSKANYWRKRSKNDGVIDFRMTNNAVYNLVRALNKPYVGAHVLYQGSEVKIWNAESIDYNSSNIEPGKILASDCDGIVVKCGKGAIRLATKDFDKIPKTGDYFK